MAADFSSHLLGSLTKADPGFFRGLMILVDDAGGEWPMIGHAPWNGCNLADFVMPFFLFIVGMSIALALKWGSNCRVLGGACVLIVYLAVIYGSNVPDWQFTIHNPDSADFGKTFTVACNVRGKLDPPCNAVGYVDREIMGINHMYEHPAWKRSKKFNFTCEFLRNIDFDADHSSRLRHWVLTGLPLFVFGITLHLTNGENRLYTLSYVCVTSGAAALVFSAFYILVDIWKLKYLFLPFEWIGMNVMLVYVMAAEGSFAGFINGWYYDNPHNTLDCDFNICYLRGDTFMGFSCQYSGLYRHILDFIAYNA
ncbi:hypothetical protein LguiB_006153 [Lonicera macranthoides]